MKHPSKQRGDAHTAIIVILVIALIGALGWIAWQRFSSKPDGAVAPQTSESTPDSTQPNDDTDGEIDTPDEMPTDDNDEEAVATPDEENTDADKKQKPQKKLVLSFTGWEVGSNFDTSYGGLYYSEEGSMIKFVGAIPKTVGCGYGSAGTIVRYAPSDEMAFGVGGPVAPASEQFASSAAKSHTWKKVSGNYYLFVSPQATCSDKQLTAQNNAVKAARSVVSHLESLN